MPRSEESAAVGAESSIVHEGRREPVPGGERTSVNTSNLVVTKGVAMVLAHEPLHTNEIQVPLILILSQLTDLETGVRLPVVAVAVSPPHSLRAADTVDGNVGTNSTTLALLELGLDLGDLIVDDIVGVAADVVVSSVLGGNGDLEESEESDQHGHHALGLAEVRHDVDEARMNSVSCVTNGRGRAKKWNAALVYVLRIETVFAKERRDLGQEIQKV